jgi:hypothetical protein
MKMLSLAVSYLFLIIIIAEPKPYVKSKATRW